MEAEAEVSYRIQEVAERANVPEGFVRRLIAVGALPGEEAGLGSREVRRTRLLHSWEAAGFSVETIVALVDRGTLSLAFLDAPVMATPERLDRSYRQFATERGVPLRFLQAVHQALGFAPRSPLTGPARTTWSCSRSRSCSGAPGCATRRPCGCWPCTPTAYAASPRPRPTTTRPTSSDACATGLDERRLIELGTRFGDRIIALLERALLQLYRRHREHVWTEHAINHVEEALEGSGLAERVPQPPAICFVDLSGYTQLTEERGDQAAAHVAGRLASLVNDISNSRGGRPVRWLGDGGMFHFREPRTAVLAGLDMVQRAPAVDLPPAHVGIHTGPVIAQDGDVYGRTVNLAARIAAYAQAGQVVVSEETARRSGDGQLRFEPLGPVGLKGVGEPLPLYQAIRE